MTNEYDIDDEYGRIGVDGPDPDDALDADFDAPDTDEGLDQQDPGPVPRGRGRGQGRGRRRDGRSEGRGPEGRGRWEGRGRAHGRGDDDLPEGRGRGGPDRGRRPKHRGGRGRMARGDVRSALLITLLDGPGHGYELIKNLEERTEGRWKPSPGSVYPQLQLLSDEGLVTSTESNGRRIYELTDTGRSEANETFESRGVPWRVLEDRDAHGGLNKASRELHMATKQVTMTGSPEIVTNATEVLVSARRELYRLLAEA